MKLLMMYMRVPAIAAGLQVLTLALVALLLLLRGYWEPAQARNVTARATLVEQQTVAQVLRARLDRSLDYAGTEARLDEVEARFASAADRSRVVGLLSQLSSESGTRIINAANRFGTAKAGLQPVMQELTVEGTFHEVARFLDGLSRIETLTLVRSVNFTPDADGRLVRADLQLVTWSASGEQEQDG